MKCYNCGHEFVSYTGSLELPSKILGSYTVNNVCYLKCSHCGELFLTDTAWQLADEKENQLITDFIGDLAINDFIGASKTASILGISRQALHKHRRIRRGFIYSITLEGKKYYHRESVNLFRKTGNGRFPLMKSVPQKAVKYILVTTPPQPAQNRFSEYGGQNEIISWSSGQSSQPKLSGHSYGYTN